MPPEPPPGARPAGPVVLRIKLRYDDVEAMISRFAPNVGKSGLFLPTKSLQPVGAEVKFELRIANDTPVLLGLGRVKVTKPPDPANPKASFGMAIELMRVTRESRDLILRMLDRRKQLGLPEVAIPMPADLDAARRSDFVDTGVKDQTSAPIPTAITSADSGPSEALLTAPRRASGPLAVAKSVEIEPLAPEPARRKRPGLAELIERASGPIAAVTVPGLDEDVDVGAVLARARKIAGVAAVAGAGVAAMAGAGGDLDGELEALRESMAAPIEINIEAASAELARQLGGVAVRRGQSAPTSWAPPPAIAEVPKVEPARVEQIEAPAEKIEAPKVETLDHQERGALTEERAPVEEPVAQQLDEPMVRAPEPADTVADPDVAAAALAIDEPRTHEAITMIGRSEPVAAPALDEELEPEPDEEHEVEPEQIHDEIHQLGESDFEEVEHTHIGAVHGAFDEHVFATTPAVQSELAAQLDAHLAEAEQESEHDDLGIGEASGHYLRSRIGLPPAEIYEGDEAPEPAPPVRVTPLPPEYQEDFIHRFDAAADAEPAYSEPAYTEPADPEAYPAEAAYAEAEPAQAPYDEVPAGAQPYHETVDAFGNTIDASLLGASDEIEEIDDFEILAEADEEDEDLLSSSGEADVSGAHVAAAEGDFSLPAASDSDFAMPVSDGEFSLPPQRESDFAMRLDLGDDEPLEDPYPQHADPYLSQVAEAQGGAVVAPMNLAASAGHALAGFDDDEEASHGFTFADAHAPAEPVDFDEPHASRQMHEQAAPAIRNDHAPGFTPPGRFDQSDVIPVTPLTQSQLAQQGRSKRPTKAPEPDDDPVPPPPYTMAGRPPNVGWDENSSRNQWAQPPAAEAGDEIDLESALEALDVDLDDLSSPGTQVPHAATELAHNAPARRATGSPAIRPPSEAQVPDGKRKSTRIPRGRAPRASTEDGVLIDFDDDDE